MNELKFKINTILNINYLGIIISFISLVFTSLTSPIFISSSLFLNENLYIPKIMHNSSEQ